MWKDLAREMSKSPYPYSFREMSPYVCGGHCHPENGSFMDMRKLPTCRPFYKATLLDRPTAPISPGAALQRAASISEKVFHEKVKEYCSNCKHKVYKEMHFGCPWELDYEKERSELRAPTGE